MIQALSDFEAVLPPRILSEFWLFCHHKFDQYGHKLIIQGFSHLDLALTSNTLA